ncbi:MAG: hypothetical protein Q8P77_03670 [Candidatus Veblenbacteria bacterium]|nr:hypothetical protein [Candidatus Veblenbacteria bacterium]
MKKLLTYGIGVFALALMVGTVGSALASSHFISPDPFTATELSTNWGADRTYPTGGVTSVTEFGRTNVAHIGINSLLTASGGFYRTEGIKTTGAEDFGTAVQVDLYIDPAWENTAVRAGFWVVGYDGDVRPGDAPFGVIEFVNSEDCDAADCSTHISNRPDYEGFRIFDGETGWTNVTTAFEYGEWVTLGIELDTEAGEYIYYINGEEVGTASGGGSFIRELFLNSYNYGLDDFPTLNSDSYAAHWHVGLVVPTSKDECKDGGWETFTDVTFKNQGACVSYVNH